MIPVLNLPPLPNGSPQSNLAGILPLSSLIEFIDSETKLHCYQLSGRGMAWNWPITPVGARLLLEFCEKKKHEETCLLDGSGRSAPLHCIDMRWGDQYHCINPFTIRACIESTPCIERFGVDKNIKLYRPQRLQILHVHFKNESDSDIEAKKFFIPKFNNKWLAVLLIGWTLWLGIIIFCILTVCPITCAYLFMVALTGVWVRSIYGSRARPLIKAEASVWRRGVVVADHFNETDWFLFIGNSVVVDSLLNKPLLRPDVDQLPLVPKIGTSFSKLILRFLIAAQWGLIVAASAMQTWDAIIISIFIIFCSCTTTFFFRTEDSLASWLNSNKVGLEKMTVTFSGRRAMITALYAISPDDTFSWVDPILAPSHERTVWQEALADLVRRGRDPGEKPHTINPNHLEAIHEGTRIASGVNSWLRRREEHHRLPPRDPRQAPFILSQQSSLLNVAPSAPTLTTNQLLPSQLSSSSTLLTTESTPHRLVSILAQQPNNLSPAPPNLPS